MIKRKGNKKIRNATPCEFNGIKFKSILEKNCYIELKRANLEVKYEPIKFIISEGIRVKKPYLYFKKGIPIIEQNKKLVNISWTYDFLVTNDKGHNFVVEAKGNLNDIFPIKFKMFRQLMDEHDEYDGIVLVHTKRDCLEAIKWIKNN